MANIDRFRPRHPLGPQIHAVPDREKAYDSAGKRLPWAYDTSASFLQTDNNDREQQARPREPAEKGAFGKSRGSRRNTSRSRSKTAEPRSVEDERRREQVAAEERVFGSMRKVVRDETGRSALGEMDGNTVSQPNVPSTAAARGKMTEELEATEVLLYGFGEDLQWSAIDFYERVSGGGTILEDYDRTPQSQLRAFDPTHSISRATLTRSLSKAALRKKNTWAGGDHWIKITFSSREAAELACARSPHIVKGHLIYAEPWQGRGPARDEPIFATQAGVQAVSGNLPSSFSTNNMVLGDAQTSPNGSQTISSRTAAGEEDVEEPWRGRGMQGGGGAQYYGGNGNTSTATATATGLASGTQQLQQRPPANTLTRLRGAQRATLLPAEQALMPKPPKASWTAWLGGGEVIGTTVPRREDGAFDYERAGLYWRVWWWVDAITNTAANATATAEYIKQSIVNRPWLTAAEVLSLSTGFALLFAWTAPVYQVGFRILGPFAGSLASWYHSVYGATKAFSLFQSAGMGGWAAGAMDSVVPGLFGAGVVFAEIAKNGTVPAP